MDKGSGSPNVDKRGGVAACGFKKILNVNIINFKKVDKPKGEGAQTMWIRLFS